MMAKVSKMPIHGMTSGSGDPLLAEINALIFGGDAYDTLPEDLSEDEQSAEFDRLVGRHCDALATWSAPAGSRESAIAAFRLALSEIELDPQKPEPIIISMMRAGLAFFEQDEPAGWPRALQPMENLLSGDDELLGWGDQLERAWNRQHEALIDGNCEAWASQVTLCRMLAERISMQRAETPDGAEVQRRALAWCTTHSGVEAALRERIAQHNRPSLVRAAG